MAIIFTTGTINQANAASVGQAMAEKIRDDVVAHPAWDLVEEFTSASGSVRWYVFKCLAAQSGLPEDFHVVIGRTLANSELRVWICEEYNPATHTASFYGPVTNYVAYTYTDPEGRSARTFVLNNQPNYNPGDPLYVVWAPFGVSTKWWLTVAEDGFTVAFNGGANGVIHLGAYIPLTDLPIELPLCTVGGVNVGSQFPITRNPAVVGKVDIVEYAHVAQLGPTLGFAGRLDSPDALLSGRASVAEWGLLMNASYNGYPQDPATWGSVLGKLKRVRIGEVNSVPAGVAFGDAYVLDGRLWVPYLPNDHRIWDTGMAA